MYDIVILYYLVILKPFNSNMRFLEAMETGGVSLNDSLNNALLISWHYNYVRREAE
jgi:hypothetical protein